MDIPDIPVPAPLDECRVTEVPKVSRDLSGCVPHLFWKDKEHAIHYG